MKKLNLLVSALVLVFLVGCSSLDRTLFTPTQFKTNSIPERVVSIQTNQLVFIYQTNTVTKFETNNVGVAVTNQVTTVTETQKKEPVILNVTIPAHQEVIPTAWEPSQNSVGIVNTIGGATGPYGAIISTGLALAWGVVAQLRSRKFRSAAVSLAQGIQTTLESMPPSEAVMIKDTHKSIQNDQGTRDTVRDLIDSDVVSRPEIASRPVV